MESKEWNWEKVYLHETVADALETNLLNGAFDKKPPRAGAM